MGFWTLVGVSFVGKFIKKETVAGSGRLVGSRRLPVSTEWGCQPCLALAEGQMAASAWGWLGTAAKGSLGSALGCVSGYPLPEHMESTDHPTLIP